ncbi:helix-turn-helix transcriptional regulator [Pseudorhodoferax sp. Leaf265]|uniref:helix-turn-helix domain-containing protein n=1 Tax=Pseudorhodoferax sp. Leaf265 TaxID=1736315 RepID=UPI0006F5E8A9|nr:helix-turn-helix transcriptional regulator [Pseudorhodoferax sp. Leaf265]KQP02487.1 hypothetical protein ASF45_20755 [Pseudorhodoferax sp. Leaf265]
MRIDPEQLRRLMRAKGISSAELARRAQVTQSTVSRYLNGMFETAPMRSAMAIADALGVELMTLVKDEPSRPSRPPGGLIGRMDPKGVADLCAESLEAFVAAISAITNAKVGKRWKR